MRRAQDTRTPLSRGIEFILLVASFLAAVGLRFESVDYPGLTLKACVNAGVILIALSYQELFEGFTYKRRMDEALRVFQALLLGVFVLTILYWLFPPLNVGRGVLFIQFGLALVAIMAWRCGRPWLTDLDGSGESVLILGTGPTAQQAAREILKRKSPADRVIGFLGERRDEVGRRLVNPSVIGTLEDLEAMRHAVSTIVVSLDDARGRMPMTGLLRCRLEGIRILEATTLLEEMTGRIALKGLRPSWLVFSEGFSRRRLYRHSKRVCDTAAALALFALAAPLLGIVGLLVRLTSPGPSLFRQERVGEGGRPFLLYKFRTMRIDAEAESGPVWATDNDPRITPLGRLLRTLRLDELPQLVNVIRGEMSLVGPRPERPHFVEKLRTSIPYYDERHTVKPGITGWAQVKYRYGSNLEDAEEKLQYDLYYIKHMSFLFDLGIMLHTFKIMLLRRGSR
jgi:sugar transferase (PEP-CTERM system associated)